MKREIEDLIVKWKNCIEYVFRISREKKTGNRRIKFMEIRNKYCKESK